MCNKNDYNVVALMLLDTGELVEEANRHITEGEARKLYNDASNDPECIYCVVFCGDTIASAVAEYANRI